MPDEEGPQTPAPQGANEPPAPQDPPPLQNLQIPIVPNAPSGTISTTSTCPKYASVKLVPF